MKKLELYKNFLKSKRPIDEISLKKIEGNLKAKYIYNSNGIEGNFDLNKFNNWTRCNYKRKITKRTFRSKGTRICFKFLNRSYESKRKNFFKNDKRI